MKEQLNKDIVYIEKEKETKNHIRINDISSWIEVGKKRGYDKFLIKEELKRIDNINFYDWNEETQRLIKDKIEKEII